MKELIEKTDKDDKEEKKPGRKRKLLITNKEAHYWLVSSFYFLGLN